MDYGLFLDLSKEKETSGEGKAGEVGSSTENECKCLKSIWRNGSSYHCNGRYETEELFYCKSRDPGTGL